MIQDGYHLLIPAPADDSAPFGVEGNGKKEQNKGSDRKVPGFLYLQSPYPHIQYTEGRLCKGLAALSRPLP